MHAGVQPRELRASVRTPQRKRGARARRVRRDTQPTSRSNSCGTTSRRPATPPAPARRRRGCRRGARPGGFAGAHNPPAPAPTSPSRNAPARSAARDAGITLPCARGARGAARRTARSADFARAAKAPRRRCAGSGCRPVRGAPPSPLRARRPACASSHELWLSSSALVRTQPASAPRLCPGMQLRHARVAERQVASVATSTSHSVLGSVRLSTSTATSTASS